MKLYFHPYENIFSSVYREIFYRKEIYFHAGEKLFLPARKFRAVRKSENREL